MFGSFLKAAVGVVLTPVAVVADVVTLGGELTDRKETYTGQVLDAVEKNLSDTIDPRK